MTHSKGPSGPPGLAKSTGVVRPNGQASESWTYRCVQEEWTERFGEMTLNFGERMKPDGSSQHSLAPPPPRLLPEPAPRAPALRKLQPQVSEPPPRRARPRTLILPRSSAGTQPSLHSRCEMLRSTSTVTLLSGGSAKSPGTPSRRVSSELEKELPGVSCTDPCRPFCKRFVVGRILRGQLQAANTSS